MLSYLFMFHKKERKKWIRNLEFDCNSGISVITFQQNAFRYFCHSAVLNFSDKNYTVIRLLTQEIISLLHQGQMIEISVRKFPIPVANFRVQSTFPQKNNNLFIIGKGPSLVTWFIARGRHHIYMNRQCKRKNNLSPRKVQEFGPQNFRSTALIEDALSEIDNTMTLRARKLSFPRNNEILAGYL